MVIKKILALGVKKIKFIKHHDMHIFSAIGSSNYSKGVYLSADGGGDEGDRRHFTWGSFEGNIIKEFKCLRGLNKVFQIFMALLQSFVDLEMRMEKFPAYLPMEK